MKKKDPRKQLLEATAAREASQRTLKRQFRGELAKVTKVPWTWQNPYSSVSTKVHLKDRDGQPFYLHDRVVLVNSSSDLDGMKGTVVDRELMPEPTADNGYNIPIQWDGMEGVKWCGCQFLLHDIVFESVTDIEEYLGAQEE